jgi:hypothetical protein
MTDERQQQSVDAQESGQSPLPVPPTMLGKGIPAPDQSSTVPEGGETPTQVLGTAMGRDMQNRAQFAQEVHQYVREFIRFADQKAVFFFAGFTALLAFLYRNGMSERWLKPLMEWNIVDTLAFVAMFGLALSSFLSVAVVIPRTPGSRRGYLFWEAIAEYPSGREYADDIMSKSPASLVLIKAEHCFHLALVCRAKYKALRISMWVGAIGLAAALIVLLVG